MTRPRRVSAAGVCLYPPRNRIIKEQVTAPPHYSGSQSTLIPNRPYFMTLVFAARSRPAVSRRPPLGVPGGRNVRSSSPLRPFFNSNSRANRCYVFRSYRHIHILEKVAAITIIERKTAANPSTNRGCRNDRGTPEHRVTGCRTGGSRCRYDRRQRRRVRAVSAFTGFKVAGTVPVPSA